MDEKFLEHADDLIRTMTEKAIEAARQRDPMPDDFDGHCDCGNSIPDQRVALGYYRCIDCQSSLEKAAKMKRQEKAMRFSEEGLYKALEKIMRGTEQPMDCNQLYEHAEVREHAASANRVSDYLGNMWRKGLLTRVPSDGTTKARWSYLWKDSTPPGLVGVLPTARLLVERPTMIISEEGATIQIEMPDLTILVKQKKK